MKFLKTLAAIDTEVAFRWNQTLYRTKNAERRACPEWLSSSVRKMKVHDNKRVSGLLGGGSQLIAIKTQSKTGQRFSKIPLISSMDVCSVLESCGQTLHA